MPSDIDTQQLEQRARALLDERIGAVRLLARARQDTHDKRAALEHADREDAAAYAAALRAGWTDDELKKLGFDAPGRKAPGRPRRSRSAAPRPAAPPTPTPPPAAANATAGPESGEGEPG